MQFQGERQVGAPRPQVWAALHDPSVLRGAVAGCEELVPQTGGCWSATLVARVGPVTDTYRGVFTIDDLRPESALAVTVDARGRCGRLSLDLRVLLADLPVPGGTSLTYRADAVVGGLVARLGHAALTMTGHHFTGSFFRGLERAVAAPALA